MVKEGSDLGLDTSVGDLSRGYAVKKLARLALILPLGSKRKGRYRGRPRRRARRGDDGRDQHAYGARGARRLVVPPDIPPTIACSAPRRARLSQCV